MGLHRLLLLFAVLLGAASSAHAQRCEFVGSYEGSEDISLWRDDIAFVSSGLSPSPTQGGLMIAMDLSNPDEVKLTEMDLLGMPAGFGFRPHGIYIDNTTQRVYAISHSDALEEESIVAFAIEDRGQGQVPALTYLFAIISPEFPYYPAGNVWFLNDLAITTRNSLLVTQFGPQALPGVKYLWQCEWDEGLIRPDGRLVAECSRAVPDESQGGLNGMNINADKTVVWANDLSNALLWVFDRNVTTGALTRRDNIQLPGIIDNVEYDFGSGDLAMGTIFSLTTLTAGAMFARKDQGYAPFSYLDLTEFPNYSVSTSLEHGPWVVIGSPFDEGPVVCRKQEVDEHTAPQAKE